jgi:hypothetical protein
MGWHNPTDWKWKVLRRFRTTGDNRSIQLCDVQLPNMGDEIRPIEETSLGLISKLMAWYIF